MEKGLKLNRYKAFAKAGFLTPMAYKSMIIFWGIASLAMTIVKVLLWKAVYHYSGTDIINGYNMSEMIMYVLFMASTGELIYASNTFSQFADDIYEGTLAIQLIKPIDYRLRNYFSTIGGFLSQVILKIIPLFSLSLIYLYFGMGITITHWYDILIYLFSCFLSVTILDSVNFIFGSFTVFTGAAFGLQMVENCVLSFLAGTMIPLSFFPTVMADILYYLPFASIASTPNLIIMGKYSIDWLLISLAIQIFWAVLLYILSMLVYKKVIKNAIIAGG